MAGLMIALLGAALGILSRVLLGENLVGSPFITFVPGVLLATLAGGVWAGAVATAVSALLADYFLIEPYGWQLAWPSGWIAIGAFLLVSGCMVLLLDAALRVGAELRDTRDRLQDAHALLERRVEERTRELAMLTRRLQAEIETKERAEAQMRQMQKMEAVGQLTGGVAHDFNNMLAIIMGSLDLTQRRMAAGRQDIGRLVENAVEGARRAATLTQQLLAFSRQQALSPAPADINALVAKMSELLRRALTAQVRLECVLAGGLWRTLVDAGQLENALLNLAVNARDAMPEGGLLTIETQNAHLDDAYALAHPDVGPGQYVMVAVTDSGVGMTADVAARAFDPFFTTKPEGQGTGLGLSQVFGFIKQSGGHIKIYSEPGRGTSVKIYLPRHLGAAAAAVATPQAAVPRGRNEVVLAVDDDAAVLRVHVTMLRELGYLVRHAADGEAALAIMRDEPGITLLFTDVVMPGLGGRDLASAMRALNPELRVLYTTGYTANAVVHNGVVDHGVDLLPKPFAFDQLARKLRMVLDGA